MSIASLTARGEMLGSKHLVNILGEESGGKNKTLRSRRGKREKSQ